MESDVFSYQLFKDEQILVVVHAGAEDYRVQQRLRRELAAQDGYNEISRVLIDMSALEATNIDGRSMAGQLLKLDAEYQTRVGPMRLAFFAPGGSFGYSLARQFQGLAEISDRIRVEVFEDGDDACDWLDLNHDIAYYLGGEFQVRSS